MALNTVPRLHICLKVVWCAIIHNNQVLCWSLICVSFCFHSINMRCSQTKHNNKFSFLSHGFTCIWKETHSLLLSQLCHIMITTSQIVILCAYHVNGNVWMRNDDELHIWSLFCIILPTKASTFILQLIYAVHFRHLVSRWVPRHFTLQYLAPHGIHL